MWSGIALLAANELGTMFRRNVIVAGLYLASGLAAFAGLMFGLMAVHSWLNLRMTAIEASLIIAAGLLVVAGLFALVAYATRHRRRSRTDLGSTALTALPLAARLVTSRASWGTVAVAGVLLLGVVFGRQLVERD